MSVAYAPRYKSVFLYTDQKSPKISYATVTKYMEKSKSFVSKWMQRYKEPRTVELYKFIPWLMKVC